MVTIKDKGGEREGGREGGRRGREGGREGERERERVREREGGREGGGGRREGGRERGRERVREREGEITIKSNYIRVIKHGHCISLSQYLGFLIRKLFGGFQKLKSTFDRRFSAKRSVDTLSDCTKCTSTYQRKERMKLRWNDYWLLRKRK